MTKLAFVSLFLLSLALTCMIAFRLIGSEIDADGILREPFFLIPLGYLFGSLGLLIGVAALIRHLRARF